MRILLTGQCTLHWGRMEYGNLGNYAIIEPFVRELHRVFPEAQIRTTFQMSDEFCHRECVDCVPMELYYGWNNSDLRIALYEALSSLTKFYKVLPRTAYMDEVLAADLVIDFSGDIWGENASLVGKNRYLIGACKDLTAHWLGKPTALLAGSPGPFDSQWSRVLARIAMKRFSLITNREPISTEAMRSDSISTANLRTLACPAFLFQARDNEEMMKIFDQEDIVDPNKPTIGFVLCGWNMPVGPYSRWPRDESEYAAFVEAVEHISAKLSARVCLLSHNNGFTKPPNFKMIEGRDHQIVHQFMEILKRRNPHIDVFTLSDVYDAAQMKAIIGQFDMLVSGRIHGAVAGLSQFVPTVILDYGHEPKAHKLRGFAAVAEVDDYVADPADPCDMIAKIDACWTNRAAIEQHLRQRIPEVRKLARQNFELLPALVESRGAV
ncbi:MAG: polysaccharide pyruvyl transferase family protein [Caldilineaceae bacterium]|nr:polysaccharide pyruvyl transferase family protein [Caldilineaceae bacterium]